MLQLTLSQQINHKPFAFKSTGIKVYSFEEALYHVYHYWRESVDDFLSDGLIAWVAQLGHSYLAARMKELIPVEPFATRILGFLQLSPYFSDEEIQGIKESLESWEMRREWEKLKERADYFVSRGEPMKGIPLYKRALQYDENSLILNNLGVAYMQTGSMKEAYRSLAGALTNSPDSFEILLHFTEAAVLSGNHSVAKKALEKAANECPDHPDISFLHGLLAYEEKDYPEALANFNRASVMDPAVPYYVYKAVDAHLAMRQFDKALSSLEEGVEEKDGEYYSKEAEIHAAAGDNAGAIKAIKRALHLSPIAPYYAKLASYYRLDYNPRLAESAIERALEHDPESDTARMENARNKKGLGRTREYQAALAEILKSFKERYRGV